MVCLIIFLTFFIFRSVRYTTIHIKKQLVRMCGYCVMVCVCEWVFVCVCEWVFVCVCVFVCEWVLVCVCVSVCLCALRCKLFFMSSGNALVDADIVSQTAGGDKTNKLQKNYNKLMIN